MRYTKGNKSDSDKGDGWRKQTEMVWTREKEISI